MRDKENYNSLVTRIEENDNKWTGFRKKDDDDWLCIKTFADCNWIGSKESEVTQARKARKKKKIL